MAERFGYSLDVGKSLEHDEDSEHKADSANEESKEESTEKETPAVSDNEVTEESQESDSASNNNNESSENNSNEKDEAKVDSEDFGEPIVDDSDEEVTGEMLSANKVKKDILDEIKDDVEGVSEASGSVRADNDIEDLEDDKAAFNPTSAEAYAEESPAENVADNLQGAEESYVSEERPLSPEEADVKDMVDESFKENSEAAAILEEDKIQTSGLWKWGVGIFILIVLTFVVVKFGFIGPADNTPSAAVPVVDELPSDDVDSLVTDVIPAVEEDVPTEPIVPVESEEELITEPVQEPEPAPIVTAKEKDPEQLLSILKEGLE